MKPLAVVIVAVMAAALIAAGVGAGHAAVALVYAGIALPVAIIVAGRGLRLACWCRRRWPRRGGGV